MNTTHAPNNPVDEPKRFGGLSSRTKAGLGIGVVLGGAVLAWLAFGIFGVHTLFIDETVNEENPFASAPVATQQVESVPAAEDADADTTGSPTSDAAPDDDAAVDPDAVQQEASDTAPAEPAAEESSDEQPAENQVTNLGTGQLVDHDHSGDGTVNVLTNGEQTFLRFEDDFAVDNGPDLNVYLVRGADADGDPDLFDDDFIDLGDLKGNIGAQNYEVPEGVDVGEYNTVVIWCVRFGVAFNAANIA